MIVAYTFTVADGVSIATALLLAIGAIFAWRTYSLSAQEHKEAREEAALSGDLRRAEAAVEERLRSVGHDIQALELRYLIHQRRGQIGAAAHTLQTVIGIDPGADWARSGLIELALASGKLGDAEQAARP